MMHDAIQLWRPKSPAMNVGVNALELSKVASNLPPTPRERCQMFFSYRDQEGALQ